METPPSITPLAYSVPVASSIVGIGSTKAWELVRSGELPSIRIDRRVLVLHSTLEEYLARKAAEQHRPSGAASTGAGVTAPMLTARRSRW